MRKLSFLILVFFIGFVLVAAVHNDFEEDIIFSQASTVSFQDEKIQALSH